MTPIYLSSIGMIGLIVFSAVQNRKSGWRKQRGTGLRDIYAMAAEWNGVTPGVDAESEEPGIMVMPPQADHTVESAAGFSHQLVTLQSALHQHGRVVADPHKHAEAKVLA